MKGVCVKCNNCLVPIAGACPIIPCAKRLVNGPCGGTKNGKCEVSGLKDCVWCSIIPKIKQEIISIDQILVEFKDYSEVRPK